jgi:cyclase
MTSGVVAGAATLSEIADGVFAHVPPEGGWCVSNAGLIAGARTAVVVDTTATIRRTHAFVAAIEATTPAPVNVLVNTHSHGDHTFGNSVFAPRATIVGHHELTAGIIGTGLALTRLWPRVEWGDLTPTPPSLTFEHQLRLHIDSTAIDVVHVGPAHTPEDVIAWLPEQRVLFAGDLLWSRCTPFVLMGTVRGCLSALARLRALQPEVVVCGHGPVAGPDVIDDVEAYLIWLVDLARDGLRSGATPLEVARDADIGRFADWGEPERLVANLHRAYAECGDDPDNPYATVSLRAALDDMSTFNGGAMPPCHA